MIEGYITVKEAANKWGLSVRTVQTMCGDGRISGVVKFGKSWAIPSMSERPSDKRIISGKYKGWRNKSI